MDKTEFEINDELNYIYSSSESGFFDSDSDDENNIMPVELEYFGRNLDIMPQISETIFTLLPMRILCKEDCAGLCPNCGKNLNYGECSCKIEDENFNLNSNPNFEALRNFVIQQED